MKKSSFGQLLSIFKELSAKDIFADLIETLGDQCPSYATIKNWDAHSTEEDQLWKISTALENQFL